MHSGPAQIRSLQSTIDDQKHSERLHVKLKTKQTVNSALNPDITVFIPSRTVSAKVVARVWPHVCIKIAIMVFKDCSGMRIACLPSNRGKWLGDCKDTSYIISLKEFTSSGIQNNRIDAKKWLDSTSRFRLCCPWKRGNNDGASFCLPVRINNSTSPFADDIIIPIPSLRINRLRLALLNKPRQQIPRHEETKDHTLLQNHRLVGASGE